MEIFVETTFKLASNFESGLIENTIAHKRSLWTKYHTTGEGVFRTTKRLEGWHYRLQWQFGGFTKTIWLHSRNLRKISKKQSYKENQDVTKLLYSKCLQFGWNKKMRKSKAVMSWNNAAPYHKAKASFRKLCKFFVCFFSYLAVFTQFFGLLNKIQFLSLWQRRNFELKEYLSFFVLIPPCSFLECVWEH